MSLDRAISGLTLLKPAARLIPIAGQYLEASVDAILEACQHIKEVKTNKMDNHALVERAIRCTVIIIEKMRDASGPGVVESRMSSIYEIKELTEELSRMAKERAKRGSVSSLWRRTQDKEDIQGLSKRFDLIIERFGVEAQLVMLYDIEKVQKAQLRIEQTALLDKLRPIATARHDHSHAPRGCTQNTRVDIRNQIFRWALDPHARQTVLWLSGLAGTGKTTIMKSLDQTLAAEGALGGCFFASLQSDERRSPQNAVRSLVHQLAEFQPALREPICSAIRDFPAVADQEMPVQISRLLSEPLAYALPLIERPIVIMIDALDECEKQDGIEGGMLLELLVNATLQHPTKLKLIVSSRITPTIQKKFEAVAAQRLRLHEIEKDVVAGDIRLYLKAKFEEITRNRGLQNAPRWYTDEDIAEFTQRAGNLFIFAFTIVTWISNPLYQPKERLREILEHHPIGNSDAPYQPIDKLYETILQTALGSNFKDHKRIGKRIQQLLEVLVVAFRPLSISELAALLDRDSDLVRIDLANLSAVLIVPEMDNAEPIIIHHASFIDYITDPLRCSRDSPFYVAIWEAHGRVGARCLDLYHDSSCCNTKGFGAGNANCDKDLYDYASERWEDHLRRSPASSNCVLAAIENTRQRITQPGLEVLSSLSLLLDIQSERTSKMEVLDEKISIDRQVLQSVDPSHPKRDRYLNDLADGLWSMYERSGSQEHLIEAIALYRQALELRPQGHPHRDISLNNLADGLWSLYERSGKQEHIDEAIVLYREALGLRPSRHPTRGESLNNLANGLASLYEHSRDQGHLIEAISLFREALELHPLGHPRRDTCLNNLALGLRSLYQCSDNEDHLNEAIALYRDALQLRPEGHPNRDQSLNNLAIGLWLLYKRNGSQEHLDQAILFFRQALEHCSPGHPYRDIYLSSLANALWSLYQHNSDTSVLEESIQLTREALSLCTAGHLRRLTALRALSKYLDAYSKVSRDQTFSMEANHLREHAEALSNFTSEGIL